jgi:hypothetical protein
MRGLALFSQIFTKANRYEASDFHPGGATIFPVVGRKAPD